MYKVFLLILAFIIYGCKSETDNLKLSYLNLSKQPYYYSDKCYDENVEYRFYKNSYEKIFYKSDNFLEVDKIKSGTIKYLNSLQVELKEEENIFDCTVAYNDEESLTFACLNRASTTPYAKVMTLWSSAELAQENKDYDCDPYETVSE